MSPEEVTYLAVLLGSIPVGFLFQRLSPGWRQWGGSGLGALLTLLTCGPHALHSLVTALGTWGLLWALPRHSGAASMVWTFGYLLFFRTLWVWGLPEPPPYANALQLLLTLKMVSLASDVQELREAGPGAVTSETGEELIGRLQSCPGLGEILCYSYCYLGLLTGPFYRPSTYRDWVRGPLPAVPCPRVLLWARWVPALAALGAALARRFPPAALLAAEGPRGLGARLLLAVPVFGAFRLRFYVGWLLAEASCLAAAFGGYPPGAQPRPGQGPKVAVPRPKSGALPPAELWDFAAIRTVDPAGTERSRSVGQGLRRWNLSVQWWLHQYVHSRHRRWAPPLRSAWTMLVSAFWHGLHPGFYLSFLSVPLWLAAEKALERVAAVRGGVWAVVWGPPEQAKGLGGQLRRFLTMRAFDYLSVGFMLRGGEPTLGYWRSVGFCLHLLPLGGLLLALLLGGSAALAAGGGGRKEETPPEKLRAERGRGEGEGERERETEREREEEVRKRRRRKDPQSEEGVGEELRVPLEGQN